MSELELRRTDDREPATVQMVRGTAWTAIRHFFDVLFRRKDKTMDREPGEYHIKRYGPGKI